MIAHLLEREKKLERFGLKGRDAEWVALVCLHSGVFTRAQFCHFFEGARRNRASRFVNALVERGVAVEFALPNKHGGAKGCRIINKTIYRELGIENVRHRREAEDSLLLRRLLSLDYVLEYPELPWLPTEQEKVAFFDLLGIDRHRIPHRIYHGAVGKQTRYFALKLPIACGCQNRHLRLHRSGQYHRCRTAILGRGTRVALEGFAGKRHQGSGGSNRLGL